MNDNTQTQYIEVLIPDGHEMYRVEHSCANLPVVLMAIAYLLVNSSEYQDFCYRPENLIGIDSNYIYPEQFLHMLASLPEAMEALAHPRGILTVQPVETDYLYGKNKSLWTVDKNYDAHEGLELQEELALIRQINEEVRQCQS
ncbi:MAG: hypothetical protein KDD84_10685 [Caldilineaceae bacterium]|nr:hypothetical protein [Caldilineaceae bacterium]